jgi:hypothetical protein
MGAKRPLKERFEGKFVKGDIDECWEWQAGIAKSGYGQIMTGDAEIGFKPGLAHRLSYTFYIGPIPENFTIDHKCKNKKCVNPNHLQPLSFEDHGRKDNQNVNKTHCQNGHPFDEENTYSWDGNDYRQCKICKKERQAEWRKNHPNYKKEYWAKNIEENRQKQREYLEKKKVIPQQDGGVSC